MNYGATPEDWVHWDVNLGCTQDLLPVVSNPQARISALSKMRNIGKTPSRYNGSHEVAGIAQWTSHHTTPEEITEWSKQNDYGLCIQTRSVRAIDIDIESYQDAAAVQNVIRAHLGTLPVRTRANSGKCLLVFTLAGDLPKRVIRTSDGIIELLGTGQQFVAAGTHTSGTRYTWPGGLPVLIPEVTASQLDALWKELDEKFGVGESSQSKVSKRNEVMSNVHTNDPVATRLIERGLVLGEERDGRLHIECPWHSEHTSDTGISSTSYFPANTGGYARGHFRCLHAHCEHRTDDEFKAALALPSVVDDFDLFPTNDNTDNKITKPIADLMLTLTEQQKELDAVKPGKYTFIPAHKFASGKPPEWLVQDVLPQAGLAVVFGDSGSGKTFWLLDLVLAIARGEKWRNKNVKQGNVAFICAEGRGGFLSRLRAYAVNESVALVDVPLFVLGDAPNFMLKDDVRDIALALDKVGPVSVIVVDTFAQVTPGANENSGEDVGKALAHCRALHQHTGAVIVLVHHSGKDATRGARGWSGLRAAADCEIEINRYDNAREATVTKLKDGEDGQAFPFELVAVPYEMTDDGDTLASCVVEQRGEESKRDKKKSPNRGRVERLILEAMGDSKEEKVEKVVDAVVQQLVYDEGSGKRDRRRYVVLRGITSMADAGDLVLVNGFIKLSEGEKQ